MFKNKKKTNLACLFLIIVNFRLSAQKINFVDYSLDLESKNQIDSILQLEMRFYSPIAILDTSLIIPIIICQNKAKFDSIKHKETQHINGFYRHSNKTIYILKNVRFLKTIAHELNHYIVDNLGLKPKPWINEGLSEFFERIQIYGNSIDCILEKNISFLTKKNKIRISELVDWDKKTWKLQEYKHIKYKNPRTISLVIVALLMKTNQSNVIFKIMNNQLSTIETTSLLQESLKCNNIENCLSKKITGISTIHLKEKL